jgi:hypothetical protein
MYLGDCLRVAQWEVGKEDTEGWRGCKYAAFINMKTVQWNPPNTERRNEGEGEWKYNGGSKLIPGILYTCIGLLQWNHLMLLVHDKSKIKIKKEKKVI